MIFPHVNAAADKLWRWFKVPGSEAEVELKLITRSELQAMAVSGDIAAESKYAAEHFFRGFRGCKDANGLELPNTREIRAAMLEDQFFGPWVNRKLLDLAAWRDEGKGGSGSAS